MLLDVGETDLGQLRVQELHSFVVLSEELHFARAARRLRLTPGGLSRRINHLEATLGARLLERSTRHVLLTAEGRRVVPAVRRLLSEVLSLQQTTAG